MLKVYVSILLILYSIITVAQLKTESILKPKNYNGFKNMLGVNAFEWNFLQDPKNPNDGSHIYEPKMKIIESFGGIRHYLDWEKIEAQKGIYTFNPTNKGGWNLDTIYQRCKDEGIEVLVCLKNCPDWLQQTFPVDKRDAENVPAPYGSNKLQPASYIAQAKAAFQFATRFGSNKNIDASLLSVNSKPRWTGDQVNQIKVGTDLIHYIECDNERDKWWKGNKAHQSAREYAANLSAFYDGDKGKLGLGAGVKTADSTMLVVMAGLASPDVKYVAEMIEWCKENRGYRKDGSVDLCFDIINFHLYANDHKFNPGDQRTVGIAPERSEAAQVAESFEKLAQLYHLEVWITEAGYDINPKSPQRAIKIMNKSALITQADWLMRTALLYARYNIKKLFFYELYDDNAHSSTQYSSSGFATDILTRRPAINYISQVKSLMGEYTYKRTISQYPLIDIYENAVKTMYVLMLPSEKGKELQYHLPLNAKSAIIYNLNPDSNEILISKQNLSGNDLVIKVTETPVFIEKGN
jgi:hypothetical protein